MNQLFTPQVSASKECRKVGIKTTTCAPREMEEKTFQIPPFGSLALASCSVWFSFKKDWVELLSRRMTSLMEKPFGL